MKNKLKPDIQFTGFAEEWEERKFEDIYDVVSGFAFRRSDYVETGVSIINGESIQHGSISIRNLNFLPKEFLDKHHHLILYTDDIVLGLNRPITNGYLKIARVPKDLDGSLLYQRAGKIIILNDTDINFSYQLLEKEISQFVLKEAVGSDQPFISTTKLKQWVITVPSLEEEQTQIGKFFKQLDDMITLHQQEITTLKQTKQGFLQKMFPKEGESVPEVRFPGFSGDWEQLKIKDFSEETYGGGTPQTSKKEYWNGEIPWIQSSDLNEHKVTGVFAKKKITEKGLQNSATKLIPEKSIAIVTRVGVGKIALMPFEYTTSQDFFSLSNLKVNEWFGVYSLYNQLQKEVHDVQGTSIKGITKKELLDKKLYVPIDFEEQIKIGILFKQLDEVIALHQRELDDLKETKKAFLKKMFV